MNYKKGLTRIFILGFVICPIAGFFSAAGESEKIAAHYSKISYEIQKEINKEPCASILRDPLRFAELKFTSACSSIHLYWDYIRNWQDENGKAGNIIDIETASQAMNANTSKLQWEVRWFQTAHYIFGYLFLWLVSFVIFFTGKWIYRGFKSQ